jgi:hypothetical protein
MIKGAKAKSTKESPWWVAEDYETCSACTHGYAHRAEIHCFDCDAPTCPICIEQTTTLELICPGCLESREREGVS